MSFYVYILRCSDGSYYTGHTETPGARLAAHQTGDFEGYTHSRRPVTLVFTQEFPTREEALASERRDQRLVAGKERGAHSWRLAELGALVQEPPLPFKQVLTPYTGQPPPPTTPLSPSIPSPPFVLSEGSGLHIRPTKVGCSVRSRSRRTEPEAGSGFHSPMAPTR